MSETHDYIKKHNITDAFPFSPPSKLLNIIVIIPCFNENKLLNTLSSLLFADAPKSFVEVLIVINSPLGVSGEKLFQNRTTFNQGIDWADKHNSDKIRFLFINKEKLPPKKAGVGLSRKIGMDIAVERFNKNNNTKGIIVSLDADTTVEANYFTEIEKYYKNNPGSVGCNIYFEHSIKGTEYDENIYRGITLYELHLRYYIQALILIGFPYPYHTVGSCFTVNILTYVKQGGMNTKKAGEDFYFLQKIIPQGIFGTIHTTKVIPSPRISDRVSFGTGVAQYKWMASKKKEFLSYHYNVFIDLKKLFEMARNFFKISKNNYIELLNALPISVKSFLQREKFFQKIIEINDNTQNLISFQKRFFTFFNAFKIVKFANYASEKFHGKVDIIKGANKLLITQHVIKNYISHPIELLKIFREIEQGGIENRIYNSFQ